jgi:hypothetical protein
MQLTATVFEVGGRAAHHRDEAPEQVGNRVARPGGGYRYPDTADTVYREGTGSELMVMGVTGQHGDNLAGAQANAAIDHPHEAVTKGGVAQGHASEHAGGVDADECESYHPVDDRLRARRFMDAKGEGEETQDAGDGAKSDTHD